MNFDFRELLSLFNEADVRYLIVGGYAVMKYTEPRFTKDLDLWIEATPANGRAVFRSLKAFGAPLVGLTEADFSVEGGCYQMGRPPTRVDILMSVEGLSFAAAWEARVPTEFDGVSAQVVSRRDLIANKRAVGRPQDLIDVSNLLQAGEFEGEQAGLPHRPPPAPGCGPPGGEPVN
jgi:hypothetical protein